MVLVIKTMLQELRQMSQVDLHRLDLQVVLWAEDWHVGMFITDRCIFAICVFVCDNLDLPPPSYSGINEGL